MQYNQKNWQNKRGWARLNLGYDNYESLTKTTCPVLWFFADNDHNVPTNTSIPRVKDALQKAGNEDVTIVTIKNASHGFTESKSGNNNDFIYRTHLASGYWNKMEEWLKKRFILPF